MRAIFDRTQPPYHYLTRSRGSSKTTDLAAVAIVMLLVLPQGSEAYALAADADQGALLTRAMAGFLRRTAPISGAFEGLATSIRHRTRATSIAVLPADAPGAWGRRPSFLVVDELAGWAETRQSKGLWEAMSSSVAKLAEAHMVVLTTAGDPTHFG